MKERISPTLREYIIQEIEKRSQRSPLRQAKNEALTALRTYMRTDWIPQTLAVSCELHDRKVHGEAQISQLSSTTNNPVYTLNISLDDGSTFVATVGKRSLSIKDILKPMCVAKAAQVYATGQEASVVVRDPALLYTTLRAQV